MRQGGIETGVKMERMRIENGKMELETQVRVKFQMPEQDEKLPDKIAVIVEEAGQVLKREIYRQAIEGADREVVLELIGKSREVIHRIGHQDYTFKMVFGTARVKRQRIKYKASGSTEIPSARIWKTPQQVYLTRGLRRAVCELVTKESVSNTIKQLERYAGEKDLVSHGSIINILHQEGTKLVEAIERRASEIYNSDPAAKKMLAKPEINMLSEEYEYARYCKYQDIANTGIEGFLPQSEIIAEDGQQNLEQMVIIEPDEIQVEAQPLTGRKELLIYTAVVTVEKRAYYFSAISPKQLFWQVGSLLARLGVHKGEREVCFLGDGAQWQRHWFKGLKIEKKSFVLCWYHLARRCQRLLKTAIAGQELQVTLLREMLSHLWQGRTVEALQLLAAHRESVKSERFYKDLIQYLTARRPYIRNYAARRKAGLWIASTRVEQFNNWAVATRCKEKGRSWTAKGVAAIASLEAARRNCELEAWWQDGELPKWEIKGADA